MKGIVVSLFLFFLYETQSSGLWSLCQDKAVKGEIISVEVFNCGPDYCETSPGLPFQGRINFKSSVRSTDPTVHLKTQTPGQPPKEMNHFPRKLREISLIEHPLMPEVQYQYDIHTLFPTDSEVGQHTVRSELVSEKGDTIFCVEMQATLVPILKDVYYL